MVFYCYFNSLTVNLFLTSNIFKKNAHKASSGVRTSQLLISLSVSATITKHRGGKRQSIIFNKCVNRLSCLNFENSKYTGIENAHAIYSFPTKNGDKDHCQVPRCQLMNTEFMFTVHWQFRFGLNFMIYFYLWILLMFIYKYNVN